MTANKNPEESCLFCRIANDEIPSQKLYENEDFLAFLDLYPIAKGHALVIPKEHSHCFEEVDVSKGTELLSLVKKIAKAVKKATGAPAFNIGLNNGKEAGQVIMHTHFHIIPRFENDGLKNWKNKTYGEGEIEIYRDKIVSELEKK